MDGRKEQDKCTVQWRHAAEDGHMGWRRSSGEPVKKRPESRNTQSGKSVEECPVNSERRFVYGVVEGFPAPVLHMMDSGRSVLVTWELLSYLLTGGGPKTSCFLSLSLIRWASFL